MSSLNPHFHNFHVIYGYQGVISFDKTVRKCRIPGQGYVINPLTSIFCQLLLLKTCVHILSWWMWTVFKYFFRYFLLLACLSFSSHSTAMFLIIKENNYLISTNSHNFLCRSLVIAFESKSDSIPWTKPLFPNMLTFPLIAWSKKKNTCHHWL